MPDRHAELGEYLRSRRASRTPAEVGLDGAGGTGRGTRRRTAGLRREEVASLADVSVSWYTWLEQGRPVHPSAEVLDALARALRLDDAERRHLFGLAGRNADPHRTVAPGDPTDDDLARAQRVIDLLAPAPAFAVDAVRDVRVWNEPMARLLPALDTLDTDRRNLLWIVLCEPETRTLLDDWEGDARRLVAELRADPAARAHPASGPLVERLRAASHEFAAWWPLGDVAEPSPRVRRFTHPWAGPLRFETQELVLAGHPGLRVVCHLPLEGDDSVARLAARPTLP